jgi:hypothetical protein
MFDGDGTNGGTNNTFTDSSSNGYTITKNGDVAQGSFSPYGDNWSWYTKDSAISFTTFSTTGDYTAEAWVSVNGLDSSGRNTIFYGGNNTQLSIGYLTDTIITVLDGSLVVTSSSVPELFDGSWHHVAWCRSGSTNRVFLDGNLVGSATSSNEIRIQQISGYVTGYEHDGFISNARVTNTALYTANFTPPTEPLTAVSGTHVLTAQSNRFVDNSSNQYSLTINRGTPKVTPFSPFTNSDARDITTDGGSAYFAGSDVLSAAVTSGITITGSTDFCIEGWIYPTNISAVDGGIFQAGLSNGALAFRHNTNGTLRVLASSVAADLDTTATISENAWQHVAATRSGSTLRIFINGVEEASTTNSRDYADVSSSDELIIAGRYYSSAYQDEFYGYISDFRFVVGDAVYTTDFTPPTSPLTAVTNTETLLNFQDSTIYDYSGINNIDTIGDAQIDTAVKKYGTGSIEFDGSGDYLDIPGSEELNFGSGDFTMEFWLNLNSSGLQAITDPRNSDNDNALLVWINSSGQVYYYTGGSQRIVGTTVLNTGQWYHVALVKNSGTTTLYLDGTSEGSFSDSLTYIKPTTFRIGQRFASTPYNLDGYLDEFRITKGVARYTTNFTPPTAALPKF